MSGGWTSDQLFIRLLTGGDLTIVTQQPVQLRGVNPKALLVLLALRAGESVTRDMLAGLLWPDTEQPTARNRLATTLSTLRRALSPVGDGLLLADRETVALTCGRQCVDVGCFKDLVGAKQPTQLQSALDLYHGDLLVGFHAPSDVFEDLLGLERQALREMALEAGYIHIAGLEDAGELDALLVLARRLLEIETADEKIHHAIIRSLLAQGEFAKAKGQCNRLQSALSDLGVSPSAATMELCGHIPDAPPPAEPKSTVPPPAPTDQDQSGAGKPAPIWSVRIRPVMVGLIVFSSIAAIFIWRSLRTENILYMAPVEADLCADPRVGPNVQSHIYRALQVPDLKPEIGTGGPQPDHRMRAMMNCAGNDFRLLLEFHHSGSHIVCWIGSYEGRYPDDLDALQTEITNDIRDKVLPLMKDSENSCR